jgi:hypothetical protein
METDNEGLDPLVQYRQLKVSRKGREDGNGKSFLGLACRGRVTKISIGNGNMIGNNL